MSIATARAFVVGGDAQDPGEFLDGYRQIRADVVRPSRTAAGENRQQPDHEIRRVKIGADRGSVSSHPYRTAGQRVAHEISRGEMGVERQSGAHQGENARDRNIEAELARVDGAQ